MNKQDVQLEQLREIRDLMERSSRFLSLSGITGMVVGLLALGSVGIAYWTLGLTFADRGYYKLIPQFYGLLFANFGSVLVLSLLAGVFFAKRNAKKKALPIWDNTALRLLINLGIPLAVGGVFCLILLYHGYTALAAPSTLIFYGLALINASKYSINEIRYLGLLQVVAGLLAAFFIDYGLLFWAFGFGVLHVVYGILIYVKYEN
jgi:hypothetical protein